MTVRWWNDGPPAHFGPGYQLLDRMARLVDPWVMVRLQLAWLFDRIWNQTPRREPQLMYKNQTVSTRGR